MNDWKEELVTILPPEHATLEVHNILFEFISRTLSLHDRRLAEKLDKAISNSAADYMVQISGGGNGRRVLIQYEGYLRKLAAQVIEGKEGV